MSKRNLYKVKHYKNERWNYSTSIISAISKTDAMTQIARMYFNCKIIEAILVLENI